MGSGSWGPPVAQRQGARGAQHLWPRAAWLHAQLHPPHPLLCPQPLTAPEPLSHHIPPWQEALRSEGTCPPPQGAEATRSRLQHKLHQCLATARRTGSTHSSPRGHSGTASFLQGSEAAPASREREEREARPAVPASALCPRAFLRGGQPCPFPSPCARGSST